MYTQEALTFLKANKEKPFFLYLPHNSVHFPIYPGKAFAGKSPHGIYSDWIEETDWSVGQVLNAVRELGLAEKTLVIFTSDNGGTSRGSNTPLAGFKGSTLEGGMRTCTIAWWPGKIPAGTSTDAVTGMFDVLPTFAKLAGANLAADRKLDGMDIWPVLSGAPDAKGHNAYFYYRGLKLEAVRQGPWKLSLAKGLLFNLEKDVSEANNVAEANPDVVKSLTALAETMKDDLGLDGIGPGCRALGEVESPKPLIDFDGTVRPGMEAKK
jgi:arylsulfatase A-like enzyme